MKYDTSCEIAYVKYVLLCCICVWAMSSVSRNYSFSYFVLPSLNFQYLLMAHVV